MSKDLSAKRKISSGDAREAAPFQREMRPFMALQICIGDKWATSWEYRIPIEMNKGKELVMFKEIAEGLIVDALDELGVAYADDVEKVIDNVRRFVDK